VRSDGLHHRMEEHDFKVRFKNKMRITISGSIALFEINYKKKVRAELTMVNARTENETASAVEKATVLERAVQNLVDVMSNNSLPLRNC